MLVNVFVNQVIFLKYQKYLHAVTTLAVAAQLQIYVTLAQTNYQDLKGVLFLKEMAYVTATLDFLMKKIILNNALNAHMNAQHAIKTVV